MTKTEMKKNYSDAARMGLRGTIRIASEINAAYWPMRSFVTNNPLHSLEYLDFETAIHLGREKLGGKGYLSNKLYRDYFNAGRILPENLDLVLKAKAVDKTIRIGNRHLSYFEVLRTNLLTALSPPQAEEPEVLLGLAASANSLDTLAKRLKPAIQTSAITEQIAAMQQKDSEQLAHRQTLSQWCDASLGTEIVNQINDEMVLWYGAFLDEGQAPWALPARQEGFYTAWKKAALQTGQNADIPDMQSKIAQLPEDTESAVLESLDLLGIPESARENYLSLHLAALPGWTAFAKWRMAQTEYEWQQAYPIDLVQILAIRLWYEREWVLAICQEKFQSEEHKPYQVIYDYMAHSATQHFLCKEKLAGKLPAWLSEELDLVFYAASSKQNEHWQRLAETYETEEGPAQNRLVRLSAAWRLQGLATGLQIDPDELNALSPDHLMTLLAWLDDFPESEHGPIWLEAFETSYRQSLIKKLQTQIEKTAEGQKKTPDTSALRPLAQAIFCIDVRSEPFRRQLESVGHYATYGFAGFFAAFIRFRAFGSHHDTDLFPVVMEAKNVIHEVPRIEDEEQISRHLAGTKLLHAAHTLFHDLKENVVTPYIMVESIGWFFAFPFFGKTFWPVKYARWVEQLLKRCAPPIATTLTIDKLARADVEASIAAEQCLTIRQALQEWLGRSVTHVPEQQIEALRNWALDYELSHETASELTHLEVVSLFEVEGHLAAFINELRTRYRITPGWSSARMEKITRSGYTLKEQAFTVETGLKVMGLTANFAKFVLLCAHGSSNENNPFAAALDCGACGGNPGGPNARVFAAIANKAEIRRLLSKKGLFIPEDTWFLAAEHDTTTDEIKLLDLEVLPQSHQALLEPLKADLKKAGILNNQERVLKLPNLKTNLSTQEILNNVQQRSTAWNQVRPEWGLSGNAAFIIGHRQLTENLDLGGRVFLHSYDAEADLEGAHLEIIMTGPQVVTQWISMGYYFSTVDNEVYGSGNKLYHNVAGRIGIMSGPSSDLRLGLPWQTVTKGNRPYHEPMRLLVLIEAPRVRIELLIARHKILRRYYHKRWLNLVALEAGRFYQYLPNGEWQSL